MSVPLVNIKAQTAAEVCARVYLQKPARQLLRPEMTPREFLDALRAGRQFAAGIDFVSHALPAREAIWWGCLCMQHACGSKLSDPERAAGIATVRWVLQPTEENRMAARGPADAAGPGLPAGSLATAVASAAPAGQSAFASHVAAAIKLASMRAEPAIILETQRLFLNLGVEVAEGTII